LAPPPDADTLAAAATSIRSRAPCQPLAGIILGSGLGELAEAVADATVIPYGEIPGHPRSSVPGHAGVLVLGWLDGCPVAIWRGRSHFYEGWPMSEAAYPAWLAGALGAKALILTNAAGGLRPSLRPGVLMLLRDHINLPGLAGHGPLRGVSAVEPSLRFVNLSDAYDQELAELALRIAHETGTPLVEGIYAMVAGPSFETPAEARLLRALGADAVGMSTVPEVVAARQQGLRVLGISTITNLVADRPGPGPSHHEVLEAASQIGARFQALIRGIAARLPGMLGE
jgi:purine-nucleoside phosphorylase